MQRHRLFVRNAAQPGRPYLPTISGRGGFGCILGVVVASALPIYLAAVSRN
jgi:hypothetical protein